jgi:putative transposase
MRKTMVEAKHPQLSVRRQCELLAVNRNRLTPTAPEGLQVEDLELARKIDEIALRFPEFGARRMSHYVNLEGFKTTRRGVARVMQLMGLEAIYRKPRTSDPCPGHKIYPYLLRDLVVKEADEVWCTDITYIPMKRGFAYLCAIMDWRTRSVLAWKVSTTLDSGFCVAALEEAVRRTGAIPKIFNTDQGSQFTGAAWIGALQALGVRISMDGKGRWIDNVFIERLWRAVKHEGVYLWGAETVHELERHLGRWFEDYNRRKPHSALEYRTPWECYRPKEATPWRRAA